MLQLLTNIFYESDSHTFLHYKFPQALNIFYCTFCTLNQSPFHVRVNELDIWTTNNNKKLNPKKCVVMNFSFMRTKVISPKITIGNHALNEVVVFKLLGVFVQNDLTWNCHVNDIVIRASMRLHMLRILKGFRLPVSDLVHV